MLPAHSPHGVPRLHLHDGPIDLIICGWGTPDAVARAYAAAQSVMGNMLDGLCRDLPLLRSQTPEPAQSATGRRMQDAVAPYRDAMFLTPMAAVAGAVAEQVLAAMTESARLARAFVNNGGDIALHLAPGERLVLGAVDRPDHPTLFGTAVITAAGGVRGVATSGWRGRSFSLGIADAVTVLAARAADADAAATVIANDVDLDLPSITRVSAHDLDPRSDLGARLVTRAVPALSASEIGTAIGRGVATARRLQAAGRIFAAALHVQGQTEVVEAPLSVAAK
jgi:ApbE superfamily uncharacterized protein (UPF0280 family)